MIEFIILGFLQVSGPAATAEAPAQPEVEMVCTIERITGSRARKQKVCKPKNGVDPDAERAKDKLRDMQRSGSIFQPSPPTGQ